MACLSQTGREKIATSNHLNCTGVTDALCTRGVVRFDAYLAFGDAVGDALAARARDSKKAKSVGCGAAGGGSAGSRRAELEGAEGGLARGGSEHR